jgi:hypothetical protein
LSNRAILLRPDAFKLDTLAAALAETGNFKEAISTQEKAILLMSKSRIPNPTAMNEFHRHMQSYKSNKPWRDFPPEVTAAKSISGTSGAKQTTAATAADPKKGN